MIEDRTGKCYALKGNICKVLCMEQIKKRKTITRRKVFLHIVLMSKSQNIRKGGGF